VVKSVQDGVPAPSESPFCELARRYQHPPAVLHVIDRVD
jgi:hypothetical protein